MWDSGIFQPRPLPFFSQNLSMNEVVLFKLNFFLQNIIFCLSDMFCSITDMQTERACHKSFHKILAFPKPCFETLRAHSARQTCLCILASTCIHTHPASVTLLTSTELHSTSSPKGKPWALYMKNSNDLEKQMGNGEKIICFLISQLSLCLLCKSLLPT